jgi:SAM-dependent methyltransferase
MIGGDAGNMAISNSFASAMALHCSFEHFEEDSIRFIKEASRVLKPGGRLCKMSIPLYRAHNSIGYWAFAPDGLKIDEGANICIYADGYGSRWIRFYDVSHLISRLIRNLG